MGHCVGEEGVRENQIKPGKDSKRPGKGRTRTELGRAGLETERVLSKRERAGETRTWILHTWAKTGRQSEKFLWEMASAKGKKGKRGKGFSLDPDKD